MFGMLSNSNQQLPDYSDLIPNSSKSNSAGGMKESSHKKKSYKTLPPVSKEKKSQDPLISNNSQVLDIGCVIGRAKTNSKSVLRITKQFTFYRKLTGISEPNLPRR